MADKIFTLSKILIICTLNMCCILFTSCDIQMMNIAEGKVCTTLSSDESDTWSLDRLTDGEGGYTIHWVGSGPAARDSRIISLNQILWVIYTG